MSILQHPEAINSQNLQVWNNATFDGPGGLAVMESWPPLQPISTNLLEPLDQDSSKENKSPASKKPLCLRPKSDPLTPFKKSADIDAEMEEIEREIRRLSARLDLLRIRKAEQEARLGRIVPAKFMDPKQGPRKDLDTPDAKKAKESPASLRGRQRGIGPLKSLGASELTKIEESPASARLQRRGVSLGPTEIQKSVRIQKSKAPEGTPAQSRRKSCFRKPEGILEEEEAKKERKSVLCLSPKSRPSIVKASDSGVRSWRRGVSLGPLEIAARTRLRQPGKLKEIHGKRVKDDKSRSLSASPKSRSRTLAKASELRKGIATVGAKKLAKREVGLSGSIKPKVLFQEAKTPLKSLKGRVVPSRYSLASGRIMGGEPGGKRQKLSLPEFGKEEVNIAVNKRSLSLGESRRNQGLENLMKSECEIPSGVEGEASRSLSVEMSPLSIGKIAESLPKIRTSHCITESSRHSGCAKRVADLVGRKPYFGWAEDATSPCEILIFEEEGQ